MAGLGEAASIVGFISLSVQLFDGCVKGFVLLSAAKDFGSQSDILRCKLEWEHYCLNDWATTVGLFREPPELNVPYPQIVENTLSSLGQLLNNAAKLKRDYGLDVAITEEELREVQAPKRGFGRLLEKSKPQFVSDTAKVYSRRNNAWKKLKWVSVDDDKLRLLLKDIRYFNKQLRGLLHYIEQRTKRTEDSTLMRSIVSRTTDKTLLNSMTEPLETVDAAIAASARLKHRGLLLDLVPCSRPEASASTSQTNLAVLPAISNPRKHSSGGTATNLRQNPELLSDCHGHASLTVSREIARYDGRIVVVEWKDVHRSLQSKLKYRIANLASLLAEMEDSAFHSLSCLGYIKSPKTRRWAYIFRPPAAVSTPFSMKSLQDLLHPPFPRPTLNCRIDIAINLAETVLQLHTSGWLHKCIRPDNVLFFKTASDDWHGADDILSAFLGGYEYARADNPLEATEDPSALRYAQMYRHPLSIGHGRASYTKAFDLYSLGCVLLELVFWVPLQTILLRYLRRDSGIAQDDAVRASILAPLDDIEYYSMVGEKQRLLRETGPGTIIADLKHRIGETFTNVAMKCLHAPTEATGQEEDDFDDSLNIQEECLIALRELAAAL